MRPFAAYRRRLAIAPGAGQMRAKGNAAVSGSAIMILGSFKRQPLEPWNTSSVMRSQIVYNSRDYIHFLILERELLQPGSRCKRLRRVLFTKCSRRRRIVVVMYAGWMNGGGQESKDQESLRKRPAFDENFGLIRGLRPDSCFPSPFAENKITGSANNETHNQFRTGYLRRDCDGVAGRMRFRRSCHGNDGVRRIQ